mmetsp:Transcript_9166/g.12185  ORF Transcript_9166/g.12185 Transcript_9166/m.12185 type:complete len:206 (+) Transcript_9166:144-761(+)
MTRRFPFSLFSLSLSLALLWNLPHAVVFGFHVNPPNQLKQQRFTTITSSSHWTTKQQCRKQKSTTRINSISLESLMDMDVVFYIDNNALDNDGNDASSTEGKIGAVQEDGSLLPISSWSDEPAFGNSIEFLVDEEDRVPGGLDMTKVKIISVVPEASLSYGSRQVGGGMGPGNPHGEESEVLYYVEQDLLEGIDVAINPELEIFW